MEVQKHWKEELCNILLESRKKGKRYNIIFIAEGAIDEDNNSLEPYAIKNCIDDCLHYDTRITVLGHVQRGGRPSAYDRIYSSRLGSEAAMFAHRTEGYQKPIIVAVKGNEIIHLPLFETIQKTIAVTEAIQNRDYLKVLRFILVFLGLYSLEVLLMLRYY